MTMKSPRTSMTVETMADPRGFFNPNASHNRQGDDKDGRGDERREPVSAKKYPANPIATVAAASTTGKQDEPPDNKGEAREKGVPDVIIFRSCFWEHRGEFGVTQAGEEGNDRRRAKMQARAAFPARPDAGPMRT